MNRLYEYLRQNYRSGEPIFPSDVQLVDFSNNNLYQRFKCLADSGKLIRYGKGIYYLPQSSRNSNQIWVSANLVFFYKYIARNGEIMGYYSAATFSYQIGLSDQKPEKIEIVSNHSPNLVKEFRTENLVFCIRKSRVKVNRDNYQVLQLLDLLKNLEKYSKWNKETTAKILAEYIRENNITRAQVDKYVSYFPRKIYKNIYDMRLDCVWL